jgi:ribulose bisphosphate carboxylase small subunit
MDDVRLERRQRPPTSSTRSRKAGRGAWIFDRYMRTCTLATALQELEYYRCMHEDDDIRLVTADGKQRIRIHLSDGLLTWV